jgi:putative nucleotidyltransferase with HDIG domain
VVFAAPVVAAVGVSSTAHLALGAAGSRAEQAWHLAVLLAVSTAALLAVDRVARRALPLATLLELTMLFPDRAPSRLAVAREAIRKRPVEEQLARVREAGADPAVAAQEILALVAAMRVHDRPTRGHAERVRMLTDLVAEAMNVSERDRDLLRWAAILHDIGKLRVSPSILNKPGKPTDDEWTLLRAHPEHGAQIARALLPWLGEWGAVIIEHHERYDGTGYPYGLAGRDISLGGRIVAVADAYEVMTATRAYRRPISRVAAHRELVKWSGQQFDPAVVRAMVGLSAPRLRRAQGLIAWVSDIPMVASGYVPAATVARVVGAGALATGAATGVAGPAAVVAVHAPEHSGHASVSATAADGGRDSHSMTGIGNVATSSTQGDQVADLRRIARTSDGASTSKAAPAAPVDSSTSPGATSTKSDKPASGASEPDSHGTGSSGPSGSNSGDDSSSSGHGNTGSGPVGTVTSTVGGTVSSTGTVVKGTVGAVTATVDGTVAAVTDPLAGSGGAVGAVAGTVGAVTGTATGTATTTVGSVTDTATGTVNGVVNTLGGLLGGKKK